MKVGDFGRRTGREADHCRFGFETSTVDNDGGGDHEVHPAESVLAGGTHCSEEALTQGGPRARFELNTETMGPGRLFDGHDIVKELGSLVEDGMIWKKTF